MTATELLCNTCGTFTASDCPDYGSSDCPKVMPEAKCLMDEEFAKQILESKRIYFEEKAAKKRGGK